MEIRGDAQKLIGSIETKKSKAFTVRSQCGETSMKDLLSFGSGNEANQCTMSRLDGDATRRVLKF